MTIDVTVTRESKMSKAEKDYWVNTYSSCPEWCDSVGHQESGPYLDGSIRHSTEIGSIETGNGNISVTVSERIADEIAVRAEIIIDVADRDALKFTQLELADFAVKFPLLIEDALALVDTIQHEHDRQNSRSDGEA